MLLFYNVVAFFSWSRNGLNQGELIRQPARDVPKRFLRKIPQPVRSGKWKSAGKTFTGKTFAGWRRDSFLPGKEEEGFCPGAAASPFPACNIVTPIT
jgi:hypothetical protein